MLFRSCLPSPWCMSYARCKWRCITKAHPTEATPCSTTASYWRNFSTYSRGSQRDAVHPRRSPRTTTCPTMAHIGQTGYPLMRRNASMRYSPWQGRRGARCIKRSRKRIGDKCPDKQGLASPTTTPMLDRFLSGKPRSALGTKEKVNEDNQRDCQRLGGTERP